MKCSRTLPLLVFALLAPNAAHAAANKEHLQLMAEIRMLQEQQQQLQALLGNLSDALKTVSGKLDDQTAAMRKAMADQTLTITNVGDNVRVVREKADDTNVRISSVSQEIEALRQAIASQPAPQVTTPPVPGADPNAPAPRPPPRRRQPAAAIRFQSACRSSACSTTRWTTTPRAASISRSRASRASSRRFRGRRAPPRRSSTSATPTITRRNGRRRQTRFRG